MKVKVKMPNVCYIVNAHHTGVLWVNKHDTAMPPLTVVPFPSCPRVEVMGETRPKGYSSNMVVGKGSDGPPVLRGISFGGTWGHAAHIVEGHRLEREDGRGDVFMRVDAQAYVPHKHIALPAARHLDDVFGNIVGGEDARPRNAE